MIKSRGSYILNEEEPKWICKEVEIQSCKGVYFISFLFLRRTYLHTLHRTDDLTLKIEICQNGDVHVYCEMQKRQKLNHSEEKVGIAKGGTFLKPLYIVKRFSVLTVPKFLWDRNSHSVT